MKNQVKRYGVIAIAIAYLLMSTLLVGFKTDQIFLVVVFLGSYFFSSISRKFIIGFSVFIVFWILYDFMKAFPNYEFAEVNIENLYLAEKALFGISEGEVVLTPNEYFKQHRFVLADVLSGFFYLCWIPLPLLFASYLFFKKKKAFIQFSLTFLLVNLLGFVVYYLFPAAAPWYVQENGFVFFPETSGNTAGLIHFDNYFNVRIFQSLYEKSSNVFAAMPSLHSAYPLIVVYYGLKSKLGSINLLFISITIGIWVAAVYTSHHYILDVLAGIAVSFLGIYLFNYIQVKSQGFQNFVNRYIKLIS